MNLTRFFTKILMAGLAIAAVWIVFIFFYTHSEERRNSDAVIKQDTTALILALIQYRQVFGSYPVGNSAMKELFGDNPQRKAFLEASVDSKNDLGELCDRWGTPYRIYFSQNHVLIHSAGPDRKFSTYQEGTSGDDIFRSF